MTDEMLAWQTQRIDLSRLQGESWIDSSRQMGGRGGGSPTRLGFGRVCA